VTRRRSGAPRPPGQEARPKLTVRKHVLYAGEGALRTALPPGVEAPDADGYRCVSVAPLLASRID
jgi:hypothetical protein